MSHLMVAVSSTQKPMPISVCCIHCAAENEAGKTDDGILDNVVCLSWSVTVVHAEPSNLWNGLKLATRLMRCLFIGSEITSAIHWK